MRTRQISRGPLNFAIVSIVFTFVALVTAASSFGASSDLDTSFGTGGKVSQGIGWGDAHANAVAVQPDGKVVAAGDTYDGFTYTIFAVARFNANGSLDASFSGDGVTFTQFYGSSDDIARAVAVQPDGKILVAGESDNSGTRYFAITRLNADGSTDSSFGIGGKATVYMDGVASAMAIQPDRKIVLTGAAFNGINQDFGVIRLNPDGSLDGTFDGDGKLTTTIGLGSDYPTGAVIQPDGKIVVAGKMHNGSNYDFALIRFNADGSLDNSFDFNAITLTGIGSGNDELTDLALQPDGKLVVSGYAHNGTNNDFALARFNSDGSLDGAFDGDGRLTTTFGGGEDVANGVAIQADGRVLAAGGAHSGINDDFALARFNADGSPDTSFDGDGKLLTPIGGANDSGRDVAIASNGRIFVAGNVAAPFSNFGLASYIGDPPPVPAAGPSASAPISSITSPAKSKLKRSKLRTLKGTAGPAGQVARVEVALRKIDKKLLKRKRCLWLKNDRAKFAKTKSEGKKCTTPRFLTAAGTDSWTYKLKRKLATGSYELFVRVTLGDGAIQTTFAAAQGNYRRFNLR